MIKRTVLFLFFFCVYCLSYSQTQAIEYAKQGMNLFDEGKYADAIEKYKKGKLLEPTNSLFSYEISLSYFMLKNYPLSISTLDSVMKRPDVNDQFYQLLGDAYDMTGQPDSAIKILKTGMKKFSKAANLSMEAGVVEFSRKNYAAAHDYWINGINMNPAFAENYYHLANFYSDSSNRIPAILYAEIYLNLQRNKAQAAEVNKLICKLYNQSIMMMADSSVTLHLTDRNTGQFNNADSVKNFCEAVNNTYYITGTKLKGKKLKAGIEAVISVRETFIKTWFEQKYNMKYPFSLFEFEKQLLDAGHFGSYSQWVMMKCNATEFQAWHKEHSKQYADFVEWYKKHPLNIQNSQEIHGCR
jgi:tetratricopeptide (TPR) repeat protein